MSCVDTKAQFIGTLENISWDVCGCGSLITLSELSDDCPLFDSLSDDIVPMYKISTLYRSSRHQSISPTTSKSDLMYTIRPKNVYKRRACFLFFWGVVSEAWIHVDCVFSSDQVMVGNKWLGRDSLDSSLEEGMVTQHRDCLPFILFLKASFKI